MWSYFVNFSAAILILLVIPFSVHSYSTGAPSSEEICRSMKPGHGVDERKTETPYEIVLERDEVAPGNRVRVTIKAKAGRNTEFMGFMLEGKRRADNTDVLDESTAEGRFSLGNDASSNDAKLIDCYDITGSAITHTNNRPKKVVSFEWRAPDQEGEYVIVGTVVKSFSEFWTKITSPKITVRNGIFGNRKTRSDHKKKKTFRSKITHKVRKVVKKIF